MLFKSLEEVADYVEEIVHKHMANHNPISIKALQREVKLMSILFDEPRMVDWLHKYLNILVDKGILDVRHGYLYRRTGSICGVHNTDGFAHSSLHNLRS